MIRISPLIYEDGPYVIVAAARNVNSLMCGVEIHAIHTLKGWQFRYLLAIVRIHGSHLRGRTCPNKQAARFFVEGSVTTPLAADGPCGHHLAHLRIDDLNFVRG